MIKQLLNYITKPKQDIKLGRLSLKHDCQKKEIINMFYSNSDHCGDKICGNVVKNKEILDNKLKLLNKSKRIKLLFWFIKENVQRITCITQIFTIFV